MSSPTRGQIEREVELTSTGGVRWSDRPVLAAGVLTDAGFDIRLVAIDR
ncbi:MAG: hypothetical protein AAGA99_13220 [Actinomycetota bacterium]